MSSWCIKCSVGEICWYYDFLLLLINTICLRMSVPFYKRDVLLILLCDAKILYTLTNAIISDKVTLFLVLLCNLMCISWLTKKDFLKPRWYWCFSDSVFQDSVSVDTAVSSLLFDGLLKINFVKLTLPLSLIASDGLWWMSLTVYEFLLRVWRATMKPALQAAANITRQPRV